MEFTLEALETPALTKAHLADLLFKPICSNSRSARCALVSAKLKEQIHGSISEEAPQEVEWSLGSE